jgi:hypothetical protein
MGIHYDKSIRREDHASQARIGFPSCSGVRHIRLVIANCSVGIAKCLPMSELAETLRAVFREGIHRDGSHNHYQAHRWN